MAAAYIVAALAYGKNPQQKINHKRRGFQFVFERRISIRRPTAVQLYVQTNTAIFPDLNQRVIVRTRPRPCETSYLRLLFYFYIDIRYHSDDVIAQDTYTYVMCCMWQGPSRLSDIIVMESQITRPAGLALLLFRDQLSRRFKGGFSWNRRVTNEKTELTDQSAITLLKCMKRPPNLIYGHFTF